MKTEDHPLDYRTFEGVIPEGNYGAGEVIVWDEGFYELFEGDDPVAQIAKGKLKIVLAGHKLKGLFTLVKMKPREGEHGEPWLMFKDHDEYEDPNWKMEEHAQSVKTGKTLAQLQASRKDAPIWKSNRAASADGTAVKRARAREGGQSRTDPARRQADAHHARRRAVRRRALAVRAEVGRLSRDRGDRERRGDAHVAQRQGPAAPVPRDEDARDGVSLDPGRGRRRAVRARRRTAGRTSRRCSRATSPKRAASSAASRRR